jgi:DNA polymerase zeta
MTTSTTFPEPFKFRLNCIDHYQAIPSALDPQLSTSLKDDAPRVPVIRVFGSTETGQKVCAHIHGAFPYLYLEYKGDLEKNEGMPSKEFLVSILCSLMVAFIF